MSVHDLLPPNSTQLERDFSRTLNVLPVLAPANQQLRTAKIIDRGPPASVLPWLVYEWGLSGITEFHPDLLTVLQEGIPWLWIRGTPAAIETAIGWLGVDPTVDETDSGRGFYRWHEFQVGVDRVMTMSELQGLVRLAWLSSAARSRLQRVFFFYDFRRFVLSGEAYECQLSGGAILSDHSGVRPQELQWCRCPDEVPVQVSFGRPFGTFLDHQTQVVIGLTRVRGSLVPAGWTWILSQTAVLSDGYHQPSDDLGRMSLRGDEVDWEVNSQLWGSLPWPDVPWSSAADLISTAHTSLA